MSERSRKRVCIVEALSRAGVTLDTSLIAAAVHAFDAGRSGRIKPL
jgi:hypothetical protein